MIKKILQVKENPARTTVQSGGVLRQTTQEIKISDIKTKEIKKVLKEMSEALASQDDGVAIAAPQIGYSLSIFIVSEKVFSKDFGKKTTTSNTVIPENTPHPNPLQPLLPPLIRGDKRFPPDKGEHKGVKERVNKDLIFINPKISKLSRKKEWMPEGCLSVRPLYGKTFRSIKATITAYDENGKKFERGGSGLLAQIFQHETEHLKGILFIDHAKDIKEEMPTK